jgi:hypothetical protein
MAVDLRAEFQREAGFAGPCSADKCMDGDINLVVDPRLQFGKDVFASDQRELPGFGDE